ncbi:MAG: hypothetical protein R3C05_12260 [Pirellulaceae bacterium]
MELDDDDLIQPIEVQVDDGKLMLIANAASVNGLTIALETSAFLGFAAGQKVRLPT